MEPDAKLAALVQLLEDPSPTVSAAVDDALRAYGQDLPAALARAQITPDQAQSRRLEELTAPARRATLIGAWSKALAHLDGLDLLEIALSYLAAYFSPWDARPDQLSTSLDELAQSARLAPEEPDASPTSLARWLFSGPSPMLSGDVETYSESHNANLLSVLRRRAGNPISLCCIYMLVGRRLGLEIGGCNFPGHFLARYTDEAGTWLVDCFNGGQIIPALELARHHQLANPTFAEVALRDTTPEAILMRFLRNLQATLPDRILLDALSRLLLTYP